MINGIAKTFKKDDKVIFVDIYSHNDNLKRISESLNEDFIGERDFLVRASAIHDLWKSATLTPKIIIKGKGSLFRYHGLKFPPNLVDNGFDEIEFDENIRKKNFKNYYILNLIRLHHADFSIPTLTKNTDFIYELGDEYKIKERMIRFIKDWYALKTADWVDSSIMESIFEAKDLEQGLYSEVDLARSNENNFYIIQEGIILKKVALIYRFMEMQLKDVVKIIEKCKNEPEQRKMLNKRFLDLIDSAEPKEVYLGGCRLQ